MPNGLAMLVDDKAPPLPVEIFLTSVKWFFEPEYDEDGNLVSMLVIFIPAQVVEMPTPEGPQQLLQLSLPSVKVPFNKDSWENFKKQVGKDGERSSIQVSQIIPEIGGKLQ